MKISVTELWPENFDDFAELAFNHAYEEYDCAGGRGSCKSSTISTLIPLIMRRYPKVSAVMVRKVKNTINDSVFAQEKKSLKRLNYSNIYRSNKSTHELTNVRTGQKILTLGLDDKEKPKSITVENGYIGILWIEEKTEFAPDEIDSIKLSLLRGSDGPFWCFSSFNPPMNNNNWCNDDLLRSKSNRIVHRSDYRTVPPEWLGEFFLNKAAWDKEINERLYRNVYLGECVGTGLQIFDNVVDMELTDSQIKNFDYRFHGLDWGYFPHPWAYGAYAYDPNKQDLYIFDEMKLWKKGNDQSSKLLFEHLLEKDRWKWYTNCKPLAPREMPILLNADAAEPKSVADYSAYGWRVRAPDKDRDYAFKWLQTRAHIYIDRRRCPLAWEEFTKYEHSVDKNGRVIDDYPDAPEQGDDIIATSRYALEPVYSKRGY